MYFDHVNALGRPKNYEPEEVLRKAMCVFWEKGYEATSLKDLMQATGLGKQSLYSEFGNKRSLFLEAVRNYTENETAQMISLIQESKTALGGIRAFFDTAVEAHFCKETKGCFLTNSIGILSRDDNDVSKLLQTSVAQLRETFIGRIQEGINAGEFSSNTDPEAIGMLLFTVGQGLSVSAKCQQSRELTERSINELFKILE